MEKIFKKSLALVLSAALCLTALVGCLTVSAEGTTAKPTYALDAVEGKPGDTVTVTATLSNLNKVCAEHIKVTFPAGLAIGDITDGNGKVYTRLTETTDVTDPNLVGLYSKTTTADNGTLIQFVDFVNWPNADGTYTNVVESLVIKFAVTISAEAVAGHVYDITAAVDAADYAADKLMDVDITNGSVTVAAKESTYTVSYQRTLALESKIQVNVWILRSELPSYATLDNTYMEFDKNGDKIIAKPVINYSGSKEYFMFSYLGIASNEMGVSFTYYSYVTNENGEKISSSNSDSYRVVDYLAAIIKRRATATEAKYVALRTLLSDIANYGIAAENNFGTSAALADADVWTDEIKGYVSEFMTSTDPTVTQISNPTDDGLVVNTTLDLQSEVMINFVVNKNSVDSKITENGKTFDDLKFVVTYKNGLTKEYSGADIKNYSTSNGTLYYMAKFNGFVASEFREIASCVVYVGDVKISQTKQMSMEGYTATIAKGTNTKLKLLTNAMMKYGDSAAAYLNIK